MLEKLTMIIVNATKPFAALSDWPIRLALAGTFGVHGTGKIMAMGANPMNLPEPLWLLVGIVEVLAALGLVGGGIVGGMLGNLATRLAGLAIIPVMLGAIIMVHWPQWRFLPTEDKPIGGMEFQILILSVAIYALITGLSKTPRA